MGSIYDVVEYAKVDERARIVLAGAVMKHLDLRPGQYVRIQSAVSGRTCCIARADGYVGEGE